MFMRTSSRHILSIYTIDQRPLQRPLSSSEAN